MPIAPRPARPARLRSGPATPATDGTSIATATGSVANDPGSPFHHRSGRKLHLHPDPVWDGDGPIWCAEGPRVRLAGIAAREIDGTCRPGQPCPTASGPAARDGLVALLGGPRGRRPEGHVLVKAPPMHCRSDGSAGGSRTAAWCRTGDGRDLNCALIEAGFALRWPRYWRSHRC